MTPLDADGSPLVIVLTGPSGVGKDALVNRMIERGVPIERPATMTTRPPREGEVEARHHYFVSHDEFRQHLAAGELLEHAQVYDNLYGVPRRAVRDARATGRHVVIRVDVQGAETLRHVLPGALFLSLEPSEEGALRDHLEARGSETEEQMQRRLAIARDEIERAHAFCHPITNIEGDIDATVDAVMALIEREAARADREPVEI